MIDPYSVAARRFASTESADEPSFDADPPSWPGPAPEIGYVGAVWSDHLAQATCRWGGLYVFVRQASRVEESPQGAQPDRGVTLLLQADPHLLQGDVIRLGDQGSQKGFMEIELGAAGLSLGPSHHRPGRRERGHPADRRGHTDPEARGRLMARGGRGRVHHTFAKVLALR